MQRWPAVPTQAKTVAGTACNRMSLYSTISHSKLSVYLVEIRVFGHDERVVAAEFE